MAAFSPIWIERNLDFCFRHTGVFLFGMDYAKFPQRQDGASGIALRTTSLVFRR